MTAKKPAAQLAVQYIDIAKIHPSPLNPRGKADFLPGDLDDLVHSIEEKDIINPLTVRPDGKEYEVAAGHRRLAAAKLARKTTVPCFVREMTDEEFTELMIVDNLMRKDVHPLDEAEGFRGMMDVRGWDLAEMARRVGKTEDYVARRVKLCDLVPAAAKMFRAGRMLLGHAEALCRHTAKDQETAIGPKNTWRDDVTEFDDEKMPSVAAFEKYLRDTFMLNLGKAPFSKEDPDLLPKAGACASCPLRTGCRQSLFPDVKSDDTCTSPKCYADKLQAHVAREVARGRKPLSNSDAVADRFPESVGPKHWFEVGKKFGWGHPSHDEKIPKCDSCAKGVISDGDGKGRLVTACWDDSCEVHYAAGKAKEKKAKKSGVGASVPKQEWGWHERNEAEERLYTAMAEAQMADPKPVTDDQLRELFMVVYVSGGETAESAVIRLMVGKYAFSSADVEEYLKGRDRNGLLTDIGIIEAVRAAELSDDEVKAECARYAAEKAKPTEKPAKATKVKKVEPDEDDGDDDEE